MNILFLHRNFPAQFRHLAPYFANDPKNNVVFITEQEKYSIPNVQKIVYKTKRTVSNDTHNYLKFSEDAIIHGQATAEIALMLKQKGFKPDVIYGHTWGNTMFMKDIFPDVPLICYFEWFYNSKNTDVDFGRKNVDINEIAKVRAKNSHLLVDLYSCDAGLSPTMWQKNQFPKEFHHKIKVLHDGVDVDYIAPDKNAKIIIPEKNIDLSEAHEIITYSTRGMEPYRGFPQFMEAVEILLKKRPKAHVVIVGQDRVCYGAKLPEGHSYKQIMLDKLDLDMNRVHFTDHLPYNHYRSVLQASNAHVYLTYPFVLSWGMLEAMAAGCCVIGSSTPPVEELITDGKNGYLVDFFSPAAIADKVEYVLDNQEKVEHIRQNARQTIVDNYALKDLLPQHIAMVERIASGNRCLL